MAVNFRDLLSVNLDEVKAPQALPEGTYHGNIVSFEYGDNNKNRTPYVRFGMKFHSASDDVDPKDLADIDLSARKMSTDFYLTPDAPLEAGTSLFKPNKSFNEEKYQAALKQNDVNFRANKPVATDYHSMFDETVRVNNVYNTLIIFNAQTYHAANEFFGDSLNNGRMAQVFFINKIDAKSYDIFPLQRIRTVNI